MYNNSNRETDISTNSNSVGSLYFGNPHTVGTIIRFDMNMVVTSVLGDILTIRYKSNNNTIFTHAIAVPAAANKLNISIVSSCVVRSSTIQIKSTRIVGNTPSIISPNIAYNHNIANRWSVTAEWDSNVNSLELNELIADVRVINNV